jgi:hypothetical protein
VNSKGDGLGDEVRAMVPGDVLRWRCDRQEERSVRSRASIAAARAGFRVSVSCKTEDGLLHIKRVE